ncbi:hypothetical protein GT2_11_00280 [Parageobacillus thermoglucosidasius NBRC 107763]|nr:hypothetical protein GT2_11_00280 [Parageobacillus thermoglucosidasius NBRC 107763]
MQIQNGCICCTLREDLIKEVKKLADAGNIDYIVIESSGISEPIPVAQTFTYIDKELGIEMALDECLLTEEEMKQDWATFCDPLPPFIVSQ